MSAPYDRIARGLNKYAKRPNRVEKPVEPKQPRRPSRIRVALYYGSQNIARRIVHHEAFDYPSLERFDILGEDQNGDLHAPARREGWFETFRPWKLRHLRAALASRRTGLVAFLEFE